MRFLLLASIVSLIALLKASGPVNRLGASPPRPSSGHLISGGEHIQIGCNLFSQELEYLYGLAGSICAFFPGTDRALSASQNKLTMWALEKKVWEKPIWLHHQINLNADRQTFVSLGHELHRVNGIEGRFDVALKIDGQGNILSRFSFFDHWNEIRPFFPKGILTFTAPRIPGFPADREYTHANSIYEIGPNGSQTRVPAFRPGNFIVNVRTPPMTFIIDRDMQQILWTYQHRTTGYWHDVQVLPSGNLLAYVNANQDPNGDYTSLDEIVPESGARVWRFTMDPRQAFFTPFCGGVQQLQNRYVLSDYLSPGTNSRNLVNLFLVDRITNKIVWRKQTNRFAKGIQEVKLIDASVFLRGVN